MEVAKKKVYENGHPIYSDGDWDAEDSVIVELTETEHYNDKVSVKIHSGKETNKYEFEVLPKKYRQLKYGAGESVPLGIRLYLADFGYYLKDSDDGPWGQYEYLVDAAGRFELRAKEVSNPVVNFYFRVLAEELLNAVVGVASENAVAGKEYTKEQVLEATNAANNTELQVTLAFAELNKLPLSEKTVIPELLNEMELSTEIVPSETPFNDNAEMDVLYTYNEQQDTTVVIVTLPYTVKYFKLNGESGGSCSLELTDRGELPGRFIEEYLQEEANIEISNTPQIDSSASNIELLSHARALLNNIQVTDGINIPSDARSPEVGKMLINTIEIFVRIQEIVGENRYLNLANEVFQEKADGLSVEGLTDAPTSQFDTVAFLLGLANMRLEDAEKEQIEAKIDRKGLDKMDDDGMNFDEMNEWVSEQMTQIDENL